MNQQVEKNHYNNIQ